MENKLEAEVTKVENTEETVNKPTPEEVEQFKLDYENALNEFQNKKWQIGKEDDALKNFNFIREYLEKYAFWSKNLWQGCIKLSDELTEIESKLNETKVLELTYQALEFTYYILSNPSGVGLQSAREIEKNATDYTSLFNLLTEQIDNARKILTDLQHKQDIYTSSAQGFYLEKLRDNVESEKTEETLACQNCENCDCEK